MTINDIDDYAHDFFRRISERPDPLPTYQPVKVEQHTAIFKGNDPVKQARQQFEALGTTNSNTNENNRNV
jgi:hypothetical protein